MLEELLPSSPVFVSAQSGHSSVSGADIVLGL